MSKLLNLEELIENNNSIKENPIKNNFYSSVLDSCHELIIKKKKQGFNFCHFCPPIFKYGMPPINTTELNKYIYENIKSNGLYIKYDNVSNRFYISWAPENINYDLYIKNKHIDEFDNFIPVSNNTDEVSKPKMKRNINKRQEINSILTALVPINKEKHETALKIKQLREKELKKYLSHRREEDE
jgi:hypothetical protein